MTSSRSKVLALCCLPALLVLMAGPDAALAATKKKVKAGPWSFKIRGEGETRYDDNILGLSKREKDLVDPNDPRNLERFRISRPEDLIFSPSLDLTLSRSPRRGRETDINLSLSSYQYLHNTVKDYQSYGLSVRQELSRSRKHRTALSVGGSRTPSYFLRQLVDDDESVAAGMTVHNSAIFSRNEGYVELSQEIVNRYLSVDGRYARVRRDYEFHFNERDSSANVERVEIDVFPLGKIGLRIRPYAEWESRSARGDRPSSAVVDDDVGFDSKLWGLDLRGIWGRDTNHRNTLRGYWQKESRDFNTDFTPDTGHFGREDDIKKYGASYAREFGPHWALSAGAYHRVTDASFPARPTTRFKKNVAGVSLIYTFGHRFRAAARTVNEKSQEGSSDEP